MFISILVFVLVFYLISNFILKNFQLVSPPKKQWKNDLVNKALNKEIVLNIAHRGGARERLENTIEAFDNGLKQGAHMLELDVRVTLDKQVVVVHDNNLKRLCGVHKKIESLNYLEIPKFKEQVDIHFSNKVFDTTQQQKACMPLLEEVFQRYPSILINIEIKTPTEQNINLVNDLIVKYVREDCTIWGCKDQLMSKYMKEVNPRTKRFFSASGVLRVIKCYIFGILPFCQIDEDAFEIPIYNESHFQWKLIKEHTLMKTIHIYLYFLFVKTFFGVFIGSTLMNHLRQRGVLILFWVINDIPTLKQAISYKGCSGIMTDSPSLLTQFMKESERLKK